MKTPINENLEFDHKLSEPDIDGLPDLEFCLPGFFHLLMDSQAERVGTSTQEIVRMSLYAAIHEVERITVLHPETEQCKLKVMPDQKTSLEMLSQSFSIPLEVLTLALFAYSLGRFEEQFNPYPKCDL